MSEQHSGTLVIGGSQSGLAVGYHLGRRGLPFLILDENDRLGDTWRNRWDSLRLFTPARYSGLPGMRPRPLPRSPARNPPRARATKGLHLRRHRTRAAGDRGEGWISCSRGRIRPRGVERRWIDLSLPFHNGVPIHRRGIVESCPGLYFVGLNFLYSLSSALLGGVGRDAEHVVDHIASTRVAKREGIPSGSA